MPAGNGDDNAIAAIFPSPAVVAVYYDLYLGEAELFVSAIWTAGLGCGSLTEHQVMIVYNRQ